MRFSHYADLFSAASSRDDDGSPLDSDEAQLFKLASVLFDEVPDLALSDADADADTDGAAPLTPHQRAYITSLRRRAAVSAWFEDAARPSVEAALRSLPPSSSSSSSSSSASGAARVFALLAGHQVPRACDAALADGNLRLATLVAQAGSAHAPPDPQLQADLALQLAKWREYGVDAGAGSESGQGQGPLLDPAYRRVLELLSGNVGVSEGRRAATGAAEDDVPETHVLDGLSWVQALAAGLWYAPDPEPRAEAPADGDAALRDAVEAYERAFAADRRVAPPVPAYAALSQTQAQAQEGSSSSWAPLPSETRDPPRAGTFHLLKLFSSPVHALESALAPRNFGPSPVDYRLPWHLYVLLSRVLRRRDWEDREVLEGETGGMGEGQDGGDREGNSVTADRVTEAYAAQLEALGEWDWAAFVLLHVELEDRCVTGSLSSLVSSRVLTSVVRRSCGAHSRVKAIKNLLARHVDELADSPRATFLTTTLQIPSVWLASARADAALASPTSRFLAYTLLLSAQRASEAHAIAWAELAPEALLRNDRSLVRRLLAPFHDDASESESESAHADPSTAGRVAGWADAGGVFVAYLDALDEAQRALPAGEGLGRDHARRVAGVLARTQRLAQRARDEPRTRGLTQLRLALEDMVGRLVVLAKAAAGTGAPAVRFFDSSLRSLLSFLECDELTRLRGDDAGPRARPAEPPARERARRVDPGRQQGFLGGEPRKGCECVVPSQVKEDVNQARVKEWQRSVETLGRGRGRVGDVEVPPQRVVCLVRFRRKLRLPESVSARQWERARMSRARMSACTALAVARCERRDVAPLLDILAPSAHLSRQSRQPSFSKPS